MALAFVLTFLSPLHLTFSGVEAEVVVAMAMVEAEATTG